MGERPFPRQESSEDKFFLAVQKHGKLEILLKIMDIQLVQAFIVVPGLLLEMGLFYVAARKLWKRSRREAGLMTAGLTLLFCVAAWLCGWGSDIRWSVLFWAGWLGLCWVMGVKQWFRSAPRV